MTKNTEIISKKDAETLNQIRNKIMELKKKITVSYIDLAKMLEYVNSASVNGKPIYVVWGYNTFKEYCEEELNMSVRKAEMLIAIARFIYTKLIVDKSDKDKENEILAMIDSIGWAKAYLLPRVVNNQKDFYVWAKKAMELDKRNFRDLIVGTKRFKSDDEEGKPVSFKKMNLSIIKSGVDIVESVFNHLKTHAVENYIEGPMGDGLILIRLCQQYLSNLKDEEYSIENLFKSIISMNQDIEEIILVKTDGTKMSVKRGPDEKSNEKSE